MSNYKNIIKSKLKSLIKFFIPKEWLYNYALKQQQKDPYFNTTLQEWIDKGRPSPPPASVKRSIIKEYAHKYNAKYFIESGTFLGDTTFDMKDNFERLFTIELDQKLYERAVKRFKPHTNVSVLQGDSGIILKGLLKEIPNEKVTLFWLDGHFSNGITAKGELETPIMQELFEIYQSSKRHIILIDDARLFINQDKDYPTLEELTNRIHIFNPNAGVEVADDIIRITSN